MSKEDQAANMRVEKLKQLKDGNSLVFKSMDPWDPNGDLTLAQEHLNPVIVYYLQTRC